jgi:hypothetical protein
MNVVQDRGFSIAGRIAQHNYGAALQAQQHSLKRRNRKHLPDRA